MEVKKNKILKDSFNLVKDDILTLQKQIGELAKNQEKILQVIENARKREEKLLKDFQRLTGEKCKSEPTVRIIKEKDHKTRYIGSKTGGKVHMESCPFGQKIKGRNKVYFANKAEAIKKGYKSCDCVKK